MCFRRKKTSICIRLYKTEDCCLPACLSVLLINKTKTNSLIFYFDKAKPKNVCSGYMKKYFVLLSRNNPLMLKGLKSVDLKIIQMYHFQLKWKRYTVCTNWWESQLFWSGTPTFCQMGVLNSCFQNPSESWVGVSNFSPGGGGGPIAYSIKKPI